MSAARVAVIPTKLIEAAGTLRRLGRAEVARRFSIWLALLVFIPYCAIAVPNFRTAGNLGDILATLPILGVAALGQTFVIAVGGLDLSVGQLASLVGVLFGGLVSHNSQLIWMIPLALALGIGSGIFTGMTIALTRANPVIVTFAMLSFFEGATYLYSQVSIGTTPANLSWLESERVFGLVPVAALLFAVLAIVAWLLLARTPFGSHLRAVGGNEPSARRNGVPITRTKVLAYALSGFSGAAAGLLLDARLQTGYPGAGTGLELSAIVAVIVGGTPFGGGRGTVLGTVAGALLLTVLVNALNLLNVGTEVQQIVNGAVVVVAVSLYSVRRFHRWL